MAHLFLRLRQGGEFVEDPAGDHYTYLEDARREATGVGFARLRQGQPVNDLAFEITNEAGEVLLVYWTRQSTLGRVDIHQG